MNQQQSKQEQPVPYYLRPNAEQQEINEMMKQLIPELDSPFAVTPMERGKWYQPDEERDDGTPCFVAAAKDYQSMPDYIWMPKRKDLEAGYYHLSTQEAFIEVNARLKKFSMARFVPCSQHRSTIAAQLQTKHDKTIFRKLKELMYNRLVCDTPSDVHAQRMKMLCLQSKGGTASAFGKAAYLPTLTTVVLLSLGGGN